MSKVQNLTVLGSGVLGGQIAWHSAYKGKNVVVYDIAADALDRCRIAHDHYAGIYRHELAAGDTNIAETKNRLSYFTDMAAAVAKADLVIEAVPEIPELKTSVYKQMADLLPARALIATNSSTLLPRDFAEATGRPDKYCALHYANLIWTMNMVEIMAHPATALSTLTAVTEFAIETGMLPIAVQKEQNGYVLNTWSIALMNAAQTLVTNGIAPPEDVDRTYLMVNRGARLGPMAMIDMVGMKTAFDVLNHWGRLNGDQQMLRNAAHIKTHMIDSGRMGLMAGKGYYDYPSPAYEAPDFLSVPPLSSVPGIVARAAPENWV